MRPTVEEIEQIRKIWAEPETYEYGPDFHVQREIWALLCEIDALRQDNQRLTEENEKLLAGIRTFLTGCEYPWK